MSSSYCHRAAAQRSQERANWQRRLSLVRCIAFALQARLRLPASIDIDDLVQAGCMGLMDAQKRYDAAQGATFETYASQRIRGAMLDALRERDWVPRSVRRDMRHVEHCQQRLEQQTGRAVTGRTVAYTLNMPMAHYHRLIGDVQSGQLLSYEGEGIEEEGAVYQCDAGLLSESPERLYQRERVHAALYKAIAALPARLRGVLEGYYFHHMTLSQLGECLGVSESRVCQLRRRTERRLYRQLIKEGHVAADLRDHLAYQDGVR